MKKVIKISALLFVVFIISTKIYSEKQDMFNIKNIMSPTDFQKCGLNKLTSDEMETLSNWLSETFLNMVLLAGGGNCQEHSIKFVEDSIIGLDDGSIWKSYDYISWSVYDSVLIYGDKMINLDDEEIIEVTRIFQSVIDKQFTKKPSISGEYPGIGGGHWIKKVESSGKIIILEDNSIWEISSIDRIYTFIWLPITSITVVLSAYPVYNYKYLLINTDDGEKALARYLGR